MSIQVMDWVWRNSIHKGTALLVMLAIADHCHDDGDGAYPSIEILARKTRLSSRQVKRVVQQLEASGELEINERAGPKGANVYRITFRRGTDPSPEEADPPPGGVEPDPGDIPGNPNPERPQSPEGESPGDNLSPPSNLGNDPPIHQAGDIPGQGVLECPTGPDPQPRGDKLSPPTEIPAVTFRTGAVTFPAAAVTSGVNPGDIVMSPKPLRTVNRTVMEPLVVATADQIGGARGQSKKFKPPDYWQPMTGLAGYVRRDDTKAVEILEKTCAEAGVGPAAVVSSFADYYRLHRFIHGWSDPVKTLRHTMVREIRKILGETRSTPKFQTTHQRRIEAEKEIPIRPVTHV